MSESKQRKQKHKESKSQHQQHSTPAGAPGAPSTERLKTVVRRLPPNLPEDIFWQSVQAWVTDDTVAWKSYYPGKFRSKRLNKEGIPSRAYIAFKNEEQVATFSRAYDGHVFRDKAGNESQAVVEFAPFQKIPTERKKSDARNNTIDKDEDYISFIESLKAGKPESVSSEALVAASQPPSAPTTTPLLEALKAEKLAQKDKETILRSHAHYGKDAALLKKEEVKKAKVGAVGGQGQVAPAGQANQIGPLQTGKGEGSVPLSKRGRKAVAAAVAAASALGATAQGAGAAPKQDAQGTTGKTPAVGTPSAKVAPTPGARQRAKDAHGRPHAPKGDVSASTPTPASAPAPASVTTSLTPGTADNTPIPRKRPVIGLGRQFEAALNGAGVARSPSSTPAPGFVPGVTPEAHRKKRDKAETAGGGDQKGKRREDGGSPGTLQRPAEGEVVIMQRSPAGVGGGVGPVTATVPPSPGPGGRGGHGAAGGRGSRRGRGKRGGYRGG